MIRRKELYKKVKHKISNKRPVFILTFDQRLPWVTEIVRKHWCTMVKDPYLAEVYKELPALPPQDKYMCKGCLICPFSNKERRSEQQQQHTQQKLPIKSIAKPWA